jgi:hypothetical protein
MADGHGGYRKPANPAPVSGPGALSKRTDTGPKQSITAAPGQGYGEAKAQMDAQHVAPMAAAEPQPAPALDMQGGGGAPAAALSLGAPSSRPHEPITAGVNIGAGPGASIMPMPNPAKGNGQLTALLQRLSATDSTGILAQLAQRAEATGA